MKNEELRKKLANPSGYGYDRITPEDEAALDGYCKGYMAFLDAGKTERECVTESVRMAEEKGFRPWDKNADMKPGDKFYYIDRGMDVLFFVIGEESLEKGMVITAGHIDSPRLDVKPRPLYESGDMAYFCTHYYGLLRKYQWVTMPLVIHGVICLRDGSKITVKFGDGADEPKFVINDLLPHLGSDQNKIPLAEAINAEQLNILVGGRPLRDDDGGDRIRFEVLRILNEKYGIVESDLISADLEAVPAMNASEIGFDRSFIGAYGQDDRVCSYAILKATLELEKPKRTCVCLLSDKEEVGSNGATGLQSSCFDWVLGQLCKKQGVELGDCFAASFCLSADVTAAYDPNFASVYNLHSCAYANRGVAVVKYAGSKGKTSTSDATAELVWQLRDLLDRNGIVWQINEMGKADAGGGGTLAMFMVKRNISTIDAGVPVLSMHAPYETVGKLDCYMTYRTAKAVYEM